MPAAGSDVASTAPPDDHALRILYVVYWGAAEPLGQSLVLPSVRRLAASARLSLLTFEKRQDLRRDDEMRGIRASLDDAGVAWLSLRYHKRPKWPATAWDVLWGILRGTLHGLRLRPHVVHGRTFLGGLMGIGIACLLRARFVYHAEGAYADEQVDAGVWREKGLPHRLARRLEAWLCARADGVIVLSEGARERAAALRSRRAGPASTLVVPSTVDTERFAAAAAAVVRDPEAATFVYMGSTGGRYRLDGVAAFVAAARRVFPQARLNVLTPRDLAQAEAALRASALSPDCWRVESLPHSQVPLALAACLAGVHFLRGGLADAHGAPTKLGEYWAAGLPAVVTPGMGDADEIIRRERVGVVVEEESERGLLAAAEQLRVLLRDADLAERCRQVAARSFGVGPACQRQIELYRALVRLPAMRRTETKGARRRGRRGAL
jgi:glycosyltransferase involved in cell wall biosynthesis